MTTPREVRDEALARSIAHANKEWKHLALQTLIKVSEEWIEFTADQVWDELKKRERRLGITTHDPRALGPIFLGASKRGLIEKTGEQELSRLARRHQRPVAVWKAVDVTHPNKIKGNRGELEVQAMLRGFGLSHARRSLGAGRKDDVGDIDGVPQAAIQVKWLASPLTGINQGIKEIETQRKNRRVRFGAVFVRRTRVREHPWIVVMTPKQWHRMYEYAMVGVAFERAEKAAKIPSREPGRRSRTQETTRADLGSARRKR